MYQIISCGDWRNPWA